MWPSRFDWLNFIALVLLLGTLLVLSLVGNPFP
jgi:hypothetical protein